MTSARSTEDRRSRPIGRSPDARCRRHRRPPQTPRRARWAATTTLALCSIAVLVHLPGPSLTDGNPPAPVVQGPTAGPGRTYDAIQAGLAGQGDLAVVVAGPLAREEAFSGDGR